ncbi:MAG: hypothetical protein J6U13_08400 [Salinivirgaceae bacterium]|nr:hypothetical protein [Salinivirgaceae bacterium]MBO7595197.1 hypothetical protein [Salinivirgaceae bacterium]
MKKLTLILLLMSAVVAVDAQTEEYITFGVNGGAVHNINGYRKLPNSNNVKFSTGIPGYNVGLDFGIRTSERTRFRFEVRHSEFHYKADWDNSYLDAEYAAKGDSSVYKNHIYKTKVKVWDMALALRFDYRLYDSEKWKIFVSPGFLWEFNISSESKNYIYNVYDKLSYNYDKYSFNRYDYVDFEYPYQILGNSVQLLCKYKIAKHIALVVMPEYYIYYRPFVKRNHDVYSRVTLNGGIEFNF